MRHGWGKLVMANGNSYEGQFRKNQQNGVGKAKDIKANKTKSGLWVKGNREKWVKKQDWEKVRPEDRT